MRQKYVCTHTHTKACSAVAYSPTSGKWTQSTRIFFLDTFNQGFQRVFGPFLSVLKCSHIQKGFKAFQSSRNWFKYSEKQIGFSRGNLCSLHLLSRFSPTKTWQEIASTSITLNWGKFGDLHPYIRISEKSWYWRRQPRLAPTRPKLVGCEALWLRCNNGV